ncbi:hypothetical protein [Thalassovita sp.]|uniref:hypothetical protein n=1 Tax=Thalassovita sp. TaxID=1979401 RepID=UPI002B26D780|nr:hypothetical protein [Thalassovita sp.]
MRPYFLAFTLALFAAPVSSEQAMPMAHGDHAMHGTLQTPSHLMDHGAGHDSHMGAVTGQSGPREPGQSAFAAIQEIVDILIADPATDWSKVNIDALRAHLVDMNNVTLNADVETLETENTLSFRVTSDDPAVSESIRRMVSAHATVMNGVFGWTLAADQIDDEGATLNVQADKAEFAKIRSLGFFGVMALGAHHQEHHLAIARGQHAH